MYAAVQGAPLTTFKKAMEGKLMIIHNQLVRPITLFYTSSKKTVDKNEKMNDDEIAAAKKLKKKTKNANVVIPRKLTRKELFKLSVNNKLCQPSAILRRPHRRWELNSRIDLYGYYSAEE